MRCLRLELEVIGNRTLIDRLDIEFHDRIVRLARNNRIIQVWGGRHPAAGLAALPDPVLPDIPLTEAEVRSNLVRVISESSSTEVQGAMINHILEPKRK